MAGAIKRVKETGGAKHALDKFYTKPEHAIACINSIQTLIAEADLVVEPSAGSGAFSTQLRHPNLFAFDLEPEHPTVQQQDWFTVTREQLGEGKLLIIGNPPFGVRADLAKQFIKHSVNLNATTIAFVLPKTFSKVLNQKTNLYPADYRLVIEKDLPNDGFTLEGENYHIPACWYVWTKDPSFLPGVDLRKTLTPPHPDFIFVKRGSNDAHFTLNGNNGRVKNVEDVTNPKSEHYIQVNDPTQISEVRDKLSNIKFNFKSSVNGGVAWIGQQEILNEYWKL